LVTFLSCPPGQYWKLQVLASAVPWA
jgi:hypothetical protein